jgi:hypothetical protein
MGAFNNYGLLSFQAGGIRVERFLPKNQHIQRKLLTFVIQKLMLSKNVNNTKCAPKLIFFNEKKMKKIPVIFDIEN